MYFFLFFKIRSHYGTQVTEATEERFEK